MKPHFVIVVLLLVIGMSCFVHAETVVVQAKDTPDKTKAADSLQQGKMDIYQQLEYMLKQLNLSEDQKKKIADIVTAEKAKVEPLQKKTVENWNELMRVSFAAQYNEARSISVIDNLSRLNKEITTYHAQMMRDINAQLTAPQREQLQKLIPRNKRRQAGDSGFFNFGSRWGF